MHTTDTDRLARVIQRVRDVRGAEAAENLVRRLAAAGYGELSEFLYGRPALVAECDKWWADCDGAGEAGPWDSDDEALSEYVDADAWRGDSTCWVHVTAYRHALDSRGDTVRVDLVRRHVRVDPEEPPCADERGHAWAAPIELVGGIAENPGVWGHAGGVIIHEVCLHCGCGRVIDTWAQCPECGQQGLRSVEYSPGEYSDDIVPDEVRELRRHAQLQCSVAREAAAWLAVAIRDREEPPADRPRLSGLSPEQWPRLRAAGESLAAPGVAPVVRAQSATERHILREAVRLARG